MDLFFAGFEKISGSPHVKGEKIHALDSKGDAINDQLPYVGGDRKSGIKSASVQHA